MINSEVHARKSSVHAADRTQTEDLAKASREFKDKFLNKRKSDSADTAEFHREAQNATDAAERQLESDQAHFQKVRTQRRATELEDNRKEKARVQNQYEYNQISKEDYDQQMAALNEEQQSLQRTINSEVFANPSDLLPPGSSSGEGGESHAKHAHRRAVSNASLQRATKGSQQTTEFATSNSLWKQNLEKDNFAARGKRADAIIGARLACEGNIATAMIAWMSKNNAADAAFVEATLTAQATHATEMATALGEFQITVTSNYATATAEFASANPDNPWAAAANREANATVVRTRSVTEAYIQLVETIATAEAVASTGTISTYGDFRIAETNIAVTYHRERADAEDVYTSQLISADDAFVNNLAVATTEHDDAVAEATLQHHNTKSAADTERWQEMYVANLIGMYQAISGTPLPEIDTTSEEIEIAFRYIDKVVPADEALENALAGASKTLHQTNATETEKQINSKAAAGLSLAESIADSLFTFETSLASRYEQLQTTLTDLSYQFATDLLNADAQFSKAVSEADRILAHATADSRETLDIDIALRNQQAVLHGPTRMESSPLMSNTASTCMQPRLHGQPAPPHSHQRTKNMLLMSTKFSVTNWSMASAMLESGARMHSKQTGTLRLTRPWQRQMLYHWH